ncbi:MAG TPA: response regulator [bacterium]|nr:response regulator [bacterium]
MKIRGMGEDGPRILVVDDELAIRRFLRVSLTAHGYRVLEAASAQEGEEATAAQRPDLIILDLSLPDTDGIEVTRRLREWSAIPIVVLSVRGQDEDKIAALDAGADDYLTKPFSTGELLARVRVALRHAARPAEEPVIATGDLVVDVAHRVVTVSGREISLTPIEYVLLKTLAVHAGKVLIHRHLMREVWGPGYDPDTNLLRVNISKLRHKVEPDPARPQYILTEPGVGYRLRAAT